MTQLIVARVVQGMSSAGLQLMSQTIIAEVTTPRERPRIPLDHRRRLPDRDPRRPGRRRTHHRLLGLALGVLDQHPRRPHRPRARRRRGPAHRRPSGRRRFDVAGARRASRRRHRRAGARRDLGGRARRRRAPASVVAFALSAIAFAAFFAHRAARRASRSCRCGCSRNRTIAAGIVLSTVIGVGLFSVTAYLPTYIQMAYGTSATVSGSSRSRPCSGCWSATSSTGFARESHRPLPGLPDRRHRAAAAAGLLTMALLPVGLPLWVPMLVMAVVGIGTGAFMNLIVAVVQSAAPRSDTGSDHGDRQPRAPDRLDRSPPPSSAGSSASASRPGSRRGWMPSTLTPQAVHAASPAVQAQVAELYASVFAPDLRGSRHRLRGRRRRRHPAAGRTALGRARTPPAPRSQRTRSPHDIRGGRHVAPPHHRHRRQRSDRLRVRAAAARGPARRPRRHVRGRSAAHRDPRRERPQHRRPGREGAGPRDVAGAAGRRVPRVARHPGGRRRRGHVHGARRARTSSTSAARARATRRPSRAAAVATNVGGQGAHWTCATPSPGVQREDPVHRRRRVGRPHRRRRATCCTCRARPSPTPPIGDAIRSLLEEEFGDELPDGYGPGTLPVAGDPQPDGTMRWAGADVVLGPLIDPSSPLAERFELRDLSLVRRRRARRRPRHRRHGRGPPHRARRLRSPRMPSSSPPTRSALRSCCGPPASVPPLWGTT